MMKSTEARRHSMAKHGVMPADKGSMSHSKTMTGLSAPSPMMVMKTAFKGMVRKTFGAGPKVPVFTNR